MLLPSGASAAARSRKRHRSSSRVDEHGQAAPSAPADRDASTPTSHATAPPATSPAAAYQQLLALFPTTTARSLPTQRPPRPPPTNRPPAPPTGQSTTSPHIDEPTSPTSPPSFAAHEHDHGRVEHGPEDDEKAQGEDEATEEDAEHKEGDDGALDSDDDGEGEEEADPTQPSSSSSPHPELLSADPFVSRFSHHRQLPASVISALTAPAPPLTPQPPIPHLKESVFSLHLSLLPAPSPPPPLPLPTSPPTLASLHIRPKLHPQWAVLTSRQSSATSTSTASSHPSSSSPSSTSSLTPTPTPSSSHSSTPVTHPVHRWLLPLLTSYTDLLWGGVGWGLRSATTQALALHVTNHVWKSRERVLRHNRKLSEWEKREKERQDREREERRKAKTEAKAKGQRKVHGRAALGPLPPPPPTPPSYRDQGYTRCTVLYLLPFANLAYQVISAILALLPPSCTSTIRQHRRFLQEFAPVAELQPDASKPADFRALFSGQLNDAFRIGLAVGPKATTLYAPFLSADIVVASPLGLRMLVQEEGGGWLSSVEVLVIDGADVLSMQNWAHLELLLPYINRMPGAGQDGRMEGKVGDDGGGDRGSGAGDVLSVVDVSRVREYLLQGHARFFRQTVVLSSYLTQDMLQLLSGEARLRNYAGLLLLRPQYTGELGRAVLTGGERPRQLFHRFPSVFLTQHDERFDHFTSTVLPAVKAAHESEGHVLLLVPQYADFIRLRRHFQRRHQSYAAISEYSTQADVTRNRSHFYHGRVKFLLMTERLHFFRRLRVRGTRHLLFYSPPVNAHFYTEMLQWLGTDPGKNEGEVEGAASGARALCLSLYSKWDGRELERLVGTQRALQMIEGERSAYVFC